MVSAKPSSRFRYDRVVGYSDDLPNFDDFKVVKLKLFTLVHFGDKYTEQCWDAEERRLIERNRRKYKKFYCESSTTLSSFDERALVFKDCKNKPALLEYPTSLALSFPRSAISIPDLVAIQLSKRNLYVQEKHNTGRIKKSCFQ